MNTRHLTLSALGLGLAGLALLPTAQAYNLSTVSSGAYIKWSGAYQTLQVASADWDDSTRRDIIDDSIAFVEDNPSWGYLGVAEDDDGWALSNGESELAWTSSSSVLGGAPGITYSTWYTASGNLYETDVFMASTTSFTNSNSKTQLWEYGGSNRPGQTTLVHELGHALGLGHEADVYNIMGTDWTHIHVNGSTAQAYLGEDASAGLVELYGEYEAYEDLSVSHWRRTGSSGGYSSHSRNRILTSGGSDMTAYTCSNEPCYYLRKGTTYRPEVTFENNGGDIQATNISYRLSTNDYISTYDTEIYSLDAIYWWPDEPYMATHSMTIPSGTATGWYWLGVITDVDGTLSEVREDNNATYIAKVYIY